ncbi:TolC family protein [Edwardsiella piscicida]|nr:TolC family protein [Edwardsiella piscicida]ELM3727424.1 TolC family protein [Edwardsiella piscicida]ELV7536505.1 TolC family protein [Edwardsiella piscicida]
MKIKSLAIILCAIIASPFAQAKQATENYVDFINSVYDQSDLIHIKILELESELLRSKQTNFYYSPKVSAESKYKTDNSRGEIFDSKVMVNSLIYSSSLPERFKEKDSRIRSAELGLLKEKENLYKSTMENLVGIKYYSDLDLKAQKLEREAISLYNQIEGRYLSGIAKASDVEQAKLLIQRIKTESEGINKEIELLKANIELSTGIQYPAQGVYLPDTILNKINSYKADEKKIYNNLDYQLIGEQAESAKFNAQQQDNLMQLSLVAEERYNNRRRVDNDSYAGIQVSVNVFDLDRKVAKQTGMKSYEVLKRRMDFKYKESMAKIRTLQLTSNSNQKEIKGMEDQLNTTSIIIANQKQEYNISQSSYYEMLNTQYDYFSLERRITDMKISETINKISLLQVTGNLLSL